MKKVLFLQFSVHLWTFQRLKNKRSTHVDATFTATKHTKPRCIYVNVYQPLKTHFTTREQTWPRKCGRRPPALKLNP